MVSRRSCCGAHIEADAERRTCVSGQCVACMRASSRTHPPKQKAREPISHLVLEEEPRDLAARSLLELGERLTRVSSRNSRNGE
eukprot:4875198-Pleurochrysis_carterae.AAC.1